MELDPVFLLAFEELQAEDPPLYEGRQLWDRHNPLIEFKELEFREELVHLR